MSDSLLSIGSCIRYYPASENPLSADVFFIEGERGLYVYDVGSSEGALAAIQAFSKPMTIILSHFHKDHTANLRQLNYERLLVGGKTRQKLRCGTTLPEEGLQICDGVELSIQRCPSVHENGSLILTVNREYTLLGDLIYSSDEPDKAVKAAMLHTLEQIDTRFFVVSHRHSKVFQKQQLLAAIR